MKKCILIVFASLICLGLFALDIVSTSEGGYWSWNNPASWYGNTIPGASDNVIINCHMEIPPNTAVSCNNMINNGIIINHYQGSGSLTINGSLQNYGQICHNISYSLTVYLVGDLVNYGTLSNSPFYLSNPGLSTLWMAPDATISGYYFQSLSATGNYQALSDLHFSCQHLNLNGRTLKLYQEEQSFDLYFEGEGGTMTNGVLEGGTTSFLRTESHFHISNLSMDDITWQGTIILSGPNVSVNNLINRGLIFNNGNGNYTLMINESLQNYGTIRNEGNRALTVNLAGDLANYGTLSNSPFYLSNTGLSTLWMDPDAIISCRVFQSQSDTGTYQALSDLRFTGDWSTPVNLNNRTLILHQGDQSFGLYFNGGGYLLNGILEGGTASFLHGEGYVHISNLSMDDIIWRGSILINGPNISVNNLINRGTTCNQQDGHHSLTINESLLNYGTICNNGNYRHLTVYLAGDLANYGTLSNRNFYLSNTGLSNLWMDPAAPAISCYNFSSQSTTGTYQALSDLRFTGDWNTTYSLNNRSLKLYQGEQSFGLYFSGGGNLINGTLEGSTASFLDAVNGVHISNLSMDNITWRGTILINGPNISVNNLINRGTTCNQQDGHHSLTINESLLNYGTICNNGNYRHLTVYLAGDLANYGTLSNRNFYLSNTGLSNLWMDPAAPAISCYNFSSQSTTGTYQALSDLRFTGDWNTTYSLNNRSLKLYQGEQSFGLYFSGGGNLINGTLEGSTASFLDAVNGVHISNLSMDDITWRGYMIMNGPNISVNNLINRGGVQNQLGNHHSLTINESLVNYGTIYNSGNYHLTVNLAGDLANYGTIQNRQVNINGTQNQDIRNMGTISVSNFYLVSEIGAAAWYFNGVLNTSFQNHTQIGVNVANLGVWQPRNDSGDGRLITIGNVALYLSAPENLSSYLSGSELKLRWNQVPGAVHYNVYYSDLPQGPFTTLLSQVFDNDLSDGFVQTDLSGSEPRRFYQVRAGN